MVCFIYMAWGHNSGAEPPPTRCAFSFSLRAGGILFLFVCYHLL